MSSPIALRINGEEFSDWLTAEMSFSLDDGASTFQMTVSERWQGNFFRRWQRWQIPVGSMVEVFIHGELTLTGFIDVHEASLTAEDHTVSIGGRSKSGDLVDSSVVSENGFRWTDLGIRDICEEVCAPFGIEVSSDLDLPSIKTFQIDVGTTPWEVLTRLAEKAGALVVPRRGGGISFERTSTDALPFELNCPEGITVRNDLSERFSELSVRGQSHGFEFDAVDAAQNEGQATDTAIERYRPRILAAFGETDGATAQQMAEWNKARSVGDSLSATITLPTFQDPDGDLWWPNKLIRVRSDPVGLDREMLISAVRFLVSEAGTECSLEMKHPASYTPKPTGRNSIRRNTVRTGGGSNIKEPFAAVDNDRSEPGFRSRDDVSDVDTSPSIF